jgi:hypothetical protein
MVTKVTQEGWKLKDWASSGSGDNECGDIFLRLPPDVVKLGIVGMILCCDDMGELCHNGVYESCNQDTVCPDPDVLVCNVYP